MSGLREGAMERRIARRRVVEEALSESAGRWRGDLGVERRVAWRSSDAQAAGDTGAGVSHIGKACVVVGASVPQTWIRKW